MVVVVVVAKKDPVGKPPQSSSSLSSISLRASGVGVDLAVDARPGKKPPGLHHTRRARTKDDDEGRGRLIRSIAFDRPVWSSPIPPGVEAGVGR
jgi:hypothetical protein